MRTRRTRFWGTTSFPTSPKYHFYSDGSLFVSLNPTCFMSSRSKFLIANQTFSSRYPTGISNSIRSNCNGYVCMYICAQLVLTFTIYFQNNVSFPSPLLFYFKNKPTQASPVVVTLHDLLRQNYYSLHILIVVCIPLILYLSF